MKKHTLLLLIITFLVLGSTSPVQAHSGNVDENNCHTCTYKCEEFNLNYNERHCHEGGLVKFHPKTSFWEKIKLFLKIK